MWKISNILLFDGGFVLLCLLWWRVGEYRAAVGCYYRWSFEVEVEVLECPSLDFWCSKLYIFVLVLHMYPYVITILCFAPASAFWLCVSRESHDYIMGLFRVPLVGYLNALLAALVNGRKLSSDSQQGSHTIEESIGVACFQDTISCYITPFLRRFARGEASVNGRLQSVGSSQCLILRFVTTPDPRPTQGSHVCPIVRFTTLHRSFVNWQDVNPQQTIVNSPLGQ